MQYIHSDQPHRSKYVKPHLPSVSVYTCVRVCVRDRFINKPLTKELHKCSCVHLSIDSSGGDGAQDLRRSVCGI